MKTLFIIFALIFGFAFSISGQTTDKKEKQGTKQVEFARLKTLIKDKHYTFKSIWAYPQKGPMIDMINRSNILKVNEDHGYGDLSYFGRAYSGGYSDDTGIEFDGPFESYNADINDKKNKITVRFRIKGSSDTYSCILTASSFDNASLSVNSNNKQSIRYSGEINESEE